MKDIVVGAVLLAFSGIPVVQAATLDGDSIQISYAIGGTTTVFGTFVPPQLNIPVSQDPGGVGSISGNTVSYSFGQDVDFASLGLTSVTFTDENAAKTITGVSLGADTSAAGLTSAALSFTPDSFTIALSGVTAVRGDIISLVATVSGGAVGTVPLPSSAPMFGGALVALAALGYGLKRRRGAAAA